MRAWSLGWEDLLQKEMPTHPSILAWEIPRTEESGGLKSMVSQGATKHKCIHIYYVMLYHMVNC